MASMTVKTTDNKNNPQPTYRYNFKAIVIDGSANAQFTFFTQAGDQITGHACSKLAQKYKAINRRQILTEIFDIIGKRHVFQIYFTPSTRKGAGEFTVDSVLNNHPAIEAPHNTTESTTEKAPAIETSTSSGKNQPGTPPHEVIEEMTESIVTTMAAHKNETSSNPVTAKRSILPQLSSEANKKKGE